MQNISKGNEGRNIKLHKPLLILSNSFWKSSMEKGQVREFHDKSPPSSFIRWGKQPRLGETERLGLGESRQRCAFACAHLSRSRLLRSNPNWKAFAQLYRTYAVTLLQMHDLMISAEDSFSFSTWSSSCIHWFISSIHYLFFIGLIIHCFLFWFFDLCNYLMSYLCV